MRAQHASTVSTALIPALDMPVWTDHVGLAKF